MKNINGWKLLWSSVPQHSAAQWATALYDSPSVYIDQTKDGWMDERTDKQTDRQYASIFSYALRSICEFLILYASSCNFTERRSLSIFYAYTYINLHRHYLCCSGFPNERNPSPYLVLRYIFFSIYGGEQCIFLRISLVKCKYCHGPFFPFGMLV